MHISDDEAAEFANLTPERIVLSPQDYDSFVARLDEAAKRRSRLHQLCLAVRGRWRL